MVDIIQGQAIHGVPNQQSKGPRVRVCSECKSEWMEPLKIQRIQDFQVILGQPAPEIDPGTFYLYKCIQCGHINQPALVYEGQNEVRRLYEGLLKIIREINAANKKSK